MADAGGNPIQRVIHRVDEFQHSHAPFAFAYGVVKKYGDDRGGQLAALVAFYGFLSFFPLMLVVITLTSFMAQRHPHLAQQIRDSALKQFPVVGPDLVDEGKPLPGSGWALVIGLLGLLWGALGVTQAIQYAFAEVWHVPLEHRPNFFVRALRGVTLFALLGGGLVVTVALTSLGALIENSRLAGIAGFAGATALSVALYLTVFRMLSPTSLRWSDLALGAIAAGIAYQLLQTIGVQLVQRQLAHSSQLYGAVGAVLGLIFFLVLVAQFTLYGLEVNAVRVGHFWPRRISEPPGSYDLSIGSSSGSGTRENQRQSTTS